jgi:uncharacterized protein
VTLLDTRHGSARIHRTVLGSPRATIVLTHGAGGGIDAIDLAYLATHASDVEVILLEMPWRVAGKAIAPRPKALDECWVDAFEKMRVDQTRPLIVGGRSAGARVAFRTAGQLRASGVLGLAFPLHPPGKPERSRADELLVDRPFVLIQGSRDPFGRPDEFAAQVQPHVYVVAGKGHELAASPVLVEALEALLAQIGV